MCLCLLAWKAEQYVLFISNNVSMLLLPGQLDWKLWKHFNIFLFKAVLMYCCCRWNVCGGPSKETGGYDLIDQSADRLLRVCHRRRTVLCIMEIKCYVQLVIWLNCPCPLSSGEQSHAHKYIHQHTVSGIHTCTVSKHVIIPFTLHF